ncbi:MAG: hypothetical protein CMF69_07650 [Magnetovibrio sp.]|nr:hypothetical protein [Magnetovibrio sp.]
MYRSEFYQTLLVTQDKFNKRVAAETARVGMLEKWKGDLSLTGSNSARPSYLRQDVIDAMSKGATDKTSIGVWNERIRSLIKDHYGGHYDCIITNCCESAILLALDVLAAPSHFGRGQAPRSRYLALFESNAEHHLGYGRPWPPKYKDIFADRTSTAGELGIMGRRLENLDVLIVKAVGANYDVHGIKSFVTPLLTHIDPVQTGARLRKVAERHADTISAIVGLGYETHGYGYGLKSDQETSDLKKIMGDLAAELDIPYIVDNARGIPFLGPHPDKCKAAVTTFSMDKVAGATTSGLAIGPDCEMVSLRRAIGVHSERFGTTPTVGKGSWIHFDPGREAVVAQYAALKWLTENGDLVRSTVQRLFEIVKEEFEELNENWGNQILIEKNDSEGGVEICYSRTWEHEAEGQMGIPIFCIEDKAAGVNLLSNGLGILGLQPPSCDEGIITITPGRGMLNADGYLIEERARVAVRGLATVMTILGDMVKA